MTAGSSAGILYDGVYNAGFRESILKMVARNKKVRGKVSDLSAYQGKTFKVLTRGKKDPLETQVMKAEQSNTSILYDNTFFLKLYRRLDEGVNPELEIVRFLTENARFPHVPPFAGALELGRSGVAPTVVGILQGFVRSGGDAWRFALQAVERYFNRVLAMGEDAEETVGDLPSLFDLDIADIPPRLRELIGGFYIEMVRILGKRTGELHLALSSDPDDPDFAPEPFTMLYQRSLFQSIRSQVRKAFTLLKKHRGNFSGHVGGQVEDIIASEEKFFSYLGKIRTKKISSTKFRVHGDFHLGQVLTTGRDFMFVDFEGEPARALSERRLKRSPFSDVAGMIRSFHYAGYSALLKHAVIRSEDAQTLAPWVEPLYHAVSGVYLRSYLETVGDAPFVPKDREELEILLRSFLIEKAMYEIRYELNNRPDWVTIPIQGLQNMMKTFFQKDEEEIST
jgi:maltose alpha-D-glucosyltransferase/alpha-amylase